MSELTVSNLVSAAAMALAFIVGLFVLRMVLPGKLTEGSRLKDGSRKTYKLNGLRIMGVLAAVLAVGQWTHTLSLATVNRLFWPLFVVCNVFAVVHTLYLYFVRTDKGSSSTDAGLVKDLWFGPELNPSLFGVDLKMFAYIPSLLGLWVMNLSFAAMQYEQLGQLTNRMWFYQAVFTIYIINYFEFEYGMLHTWDVIAENFGFMLVWGDYVLVPFFYCICGWALLANTDPLPMWQLAGLVAMFFLGFWIFRGANQQKHNYKENPNVKIWGKPAETVGGRLLVSGFWGIGRKINYTGELTVYTSWALATGFHSYAPYILPFWLLCLFSHRAWRDEKKCAAKYGQTWVEYCQRAKFRMFPFLY